MRIALTTLGIGLLTLATAAPAVADGIHIPGVNVQITPNSGYVPPPPQPYGYVPPPAQPYGYGQGGYGYGRSYGGGPRWHDPRDFGFRVNQRMNEIEGRLQTRVDQGFVRPRALAEFRDRRQDVDNELRQAGADGVITWDERRHIDNDVQQMQALDVRYRRNAYGGGPRWDGNPDWR